MSDIAEVKVTSDEEKIKEIVKKFYLSILGFIVITHFPSLEKWKDKSNEVKT